MQKNAFLLNNYYKLVVFGGEKEYILLKTLLNFLLFDEN